LNRLDALLARPADQRRREYQYRFAQSAVFGLPVLALEAFGRSLGGPEANRWVAILQGLLAGWVVYVGAGGMLFEAVLQLARGRPVADLLPAGGAVAFYAVGLWRTGLLLAHSETASPLFYWPVLILTTWCGLRWLLTARRAPEPASPEGQQNSQG
jgi:cation transport ATPase